MDAAVKGVPVEEYAMDHEELKLAITRMGIKVLRF